MYKTPREAVALAEGLVRLLKDARDIEVAVCPPFTSLQAVSKALEGSRIALGAQNLHWEKEGPYTGEVSAPMLKELGCNYVIIGHSERRQYFGESDALVKRKVLAALEGGLQPIVCIGETLEEREEARTFSVLERQVRDGLEGLKPEQMEKIVIAYEPVWAIGTGRTATPEQANEAQAYIRKLLVELFGEGIVSKTRILYGGSVKPENIQDLMAEPEVDGALVGGASLDAASFARIVNYR